MNTSRKNIGVHYETFCPLVALAVISFVPLNSLRSNQAISNEIKQRILRIDASDDR